MKTKQEPDEKSALVELAASLKHARHSLIGLAVIVALFAVYSFLTSDGNRYAWQDFIAFAVALELSRWCKRGHAALTEIHVRLMTSTIRKNLTDERLHSGQ